MKRIVALILLTGLIACEGPQGVAGPQGPMGPAGGLLESDTETVVTGAMGCGTFTIAEVSAARFSSSECLFRVLVTNCGGVPEPYRRVDWELIKGKGVLDEKSNVTNESDAALIRGRTYNFLRNAVPDGGMIQVKASVYGYDASVIMTVK